MTVRAEVSPAVLMLDVAGRETAIVRFCGTALTAVIALTWLGAVAFGFTTALTILTALGFAVAVLGLFHPGVGLLGVVLLCVLDTPARVFLLSGGLFRWNTFNYFLLLVIFFGVAALFRLRDAHLRVLMLFSVLVGLELIISPELQFGGQHLINLVSVFGLVLYFVYANRTVAVWVWLGIVAGVTGAGGGLAYYVERQGLPYVDPNAWAYFPLGAIFAICLAFPFAAKVPRYQVALGGLAAINLVWVFLSGSRGALFVALLCAVYFVAATPGAGRRTVLAAVLVAMALAASVSFGGLQDAATHRVIRLFDPTVALASRTSGRSDLVLGGWYIFSAHPFGVGTGGFASAWAELGRHEALSGFEIGKKFQAHAGWIKILVENGWPGILLLGIFVAGFAWRAHRAPYRGYRLLGYLTAAVLSVAWITTEFQIKGLWMLAAGTLTLLRAGGAPAQRRVSPLSHE